MFEKKLDVRELRNQLHGVQEKINQHKFNQEETRKANAIVEQQRNQNPEAINRKLADQGVPCLEDLGKEVLTGFGSWSKLHRQKRKLEQQILKAERRK